MRCGTLAAVMARELQTLLDERAAALVGRTAEQAVLRTVLGDDSPVVTYLHGIGGIGKSTTSSNLSALA